MSKAGWCRRRLRLAAAAKLRAAAAFPAGWRPQHCNLLLAKWNSGARGGNQPHREALKGEISCLHAGGGCPLFPHPLPLPAKWRQDYMSPLDGRRTRFCHPGSVAKLGTSPYIQAPLPFRLSPLGRYGRAGVGDESLLGLFWGAGATDKHSDWGRVFWILQGTLWK